MTVSEPVFRFLAQCDKNRLSDAVISNEKTFSYEQLGTLARRFASCFASQRAERVGIILSQNIDAYAAILGAGIAGCIYSPLNVRSPVSKLGAALTIFDPDVIVADEAIATELSNLTTRKVTTPSAIKDCAPFEGYGQRNPIAYVKFTSGSTGIPKGVAVSRIAMTHYLDWVERNFQPTPDDRLSQHAALSFDVSVTDIYGALCYGAALVPISTDIDRMLPGRTIARHKITVWNSVPSVVGQLMKGGHLNQNAIGSVRLFNFAGEALMPEQVRPLLQALPNIVVQNAYGPTEATVTVTELRLHSEAELDAHTDGSVAIGRAIEGMRLDLIGGPTRDEGEIVISGPQLAEGYWNSPEQTDRAFRTFDAGDGPLRGYFTGDWGVAKDGVITFKERIDFQVKINGHRVELGEIASAIQAEGWSNVCIFKRGQKLVAVLEDMPGLNMEIKDLQARLRLRLEPIFVPDTILLIEEMPRNDSDKIDRKAVEEWFSERDRAK